MKCENNYCIYNRGNTCTLSEVGIDSLGMCDSFIIVSLDEDFLEAEKSRQLDKLNSRRVEINEIKEATFGN